MKNTGSSAPNGSDKNDDADVLGGVNDDVDELSRGKKKAPARIGSAIRASKRSRVTSSPPHRAASSPSSSSSVIPAPATIVNHERAQISPMRQLVFFRDIEGIDETTSAAAGSFIDMVETKRPFFLSKILPSFTVSICLFIKRDIRVWDDIIARMERTFSLFSHPDFAGREFSNLEAR